ncbi:MAG: hypothetical protein L0322_30880, partial [Chloroflexi bacterium]|nr:hypothetical protein [Chloroflexota bacterium]
MKNQTTLTWLIALIGVLALIAAGAGLFWQTGGQPYPFTSLRGETVMINGRGLYYYDTVNSTAQMQAADLVTLVMGVPLLAVSGWLALHGSFRGQLLLAGTLGYFLYTYMSMSFNTAYNQLFLVYVALFSLSLVAFILAMMSIDLASLPQRFSTRLPRRGIAGVLFAAGGFLLLAWLGLIGPPLLQNQPPAGLESTTTLVIQAMDLGLIVPLSFLSGILLLRRSPWGYLLASVAVMKFMTMGVCVSAMGINQALAGVAVSPMLVAGFIALTLVN